MKIFRWTLPKPYDSHVHPENEKDIERSNNITKSITPKYTLDWYVKWVASIIAIVAISFRISGVPALHLYDMWCGFVSCVMWWWVALVWRDRALMLVNGVAGIMLFVGLLQGYFL